MVPSPTGRGLGLGEGQGAFDVRNAANNERTLPLTPDPLAEGEGGRKETDDDKIDPSLASHATSPRPVSR